MYVERREEPRSNCLSSARARPFAHVAVVVIEVPFGFEDYKGVGIIKEPSALALLFAVDICQSVARPWVRCGGQLLLDIEKRWLDRRRARRGRGGGLLACGAIYT